MEEKECLDYSAVCSVCGKQLDLWDIQEDFTIHKRLGYGTKYDDDDICLKLCCECMEKLIDSCAVSPLC